MQNTRIHVRLLLVSVLLLSLGAVATVHAQPSSEEPSSEDVTEAEGAGFFAIGTHFTDLAPLNTRLENAGYPTFASETISIGGGGSEHDD
jgi:opacity protein-like surface antigen